MAWKSFKFFEKEVLKDPETHQPFERLKDLDVTCAVSGRGQVVLGDGTGQLHIVNGQLDVASFQAYASRVSLMYQLKQHNVLVTVGEDEETINPQIKVWDWDKADKMGNPRCARIIRANPSANKTISVHTFCVHENMTLIAVGFADGSVSLVKGNILHDRSSRHRVVHTDNVPVTSVAFKTDVAKNKIILYVVTTEEVMSYDLNGDKLIQKDFTGCDIDRVTLSDHTQDYKIVLARKEAVYFYTPYERAQCFAFEGEKMLTRWYRGYLIVVSYGSIRRAGTGSSTATSIIPSPSVGVKETYTLAIYDIQNQFIAFTTTFSSPVLEVLHEWGSLYVLTKDNKFYRLDENDTQTKLETLFKKNLYPTAINLAKSQSYDDGLIDIFTQYGDHLYTKNDYDGAIAQYILTIGKLEPSYVIRKFLDAQMIRNLTAYLQALHEKGAANTDHTTLLLNCYTKLKDVQKLDEFIKSDKALIFDVETAIKVCRQSNYHKHALFLAEKYKQHDWYVKIQLEDINQYHDALDYIKRCPPQSIPDLMVTYGKTLMNEMPDETTDFISEVCKDQEKAQPSDYLHIFVNKPQHLLKFLEKMVSLHGDSLPPVMSNTLLELYMTSMDELPPNTQERGNREAKTLELLKSKSAKYDIDHALVLAQMHNFKAGILYLYEKAKLFQQILHYHMEHKDYNSVMDTCRRHGMRDPHLWVQALSYFGSQPAANKKIEEVLKHIEDTNLLPPLMVVQILAEHDVATLADIKGYISHRLQEENQQIAKDEKMIKQYREETAKMRQQIEDLRTGAQVFQVIKCSMCTNHLTLPAVHFLCHHSFHQNCLDDEYESECPICAPENRKVLDIIRRQMEDRELHEQFQSLLQRSPDGFSVVAEYFGRGMFNKTSMFDLPTAPLDRR
ncbi:vacuolar protein sorting-associated protein 11 homolog [Dysidea avara]|uniref:vacuolar protein sorting-associated protein 11 homolog n=1 Tax=Dysidea avara TaxID=196820 RepID=UPI003322F6CC